MNIGSSAGYNPQTEVFDVKAPLNAEQVQAVEEKFGADNLKDDTEKVFVLNVNDAEGEVGLLVKKPGSSEGYAILSIK